MTTYPETAYLLQLSSQTNPPLASRPALKVRMLSGTMWLQKISRHCSRLLVVVVVVVSRRTMLT